MKRIKFCISLLLLVGTIASCGGGKATASSSGSGQAAVPAFNADSAYEYTRRQLEFGYRIPNTPAHKATAAYLQGELARHGAEVTPQAARVTAYDGTGLDIVNIIGSFAPEKKKRVLLMAHWDSRPYADNDPDPANHRKPIPGADDGAASVAVLLEIARQIGNDSPSVGVDIIFFDAEDYGAPYFAASATDPDLSWCLGSQYWSRNPHKPGYRADFGILLDMVSGRGSVFYKEQFSRMYAPAVVDKIWNEAANIGYASYFVSQTGCAVTDDHYFVNEYAGIPCVDIIAYTDESCFPPYWHTLGDDMDNIDRNTMKAVGETVLSVIYKE